MKYFILSLAVLASAAVSAETKSVIWPQVYNYGSNVQVQVWNHTDKNVNCSGWVYMNLENNTRESEYYFEFVSARFTSYRSFYPRFGGQRITSVSHSIFCN